MSLSCDQPDDLIALALLQKGETEEGDDVLFEAGYEYRYSDRAFMGGLGTQVIHRCLHQSAVITLELLSAFSACLAAEERVRVSVVHERTV